MSRGLPLPSPSGRLKPPPVLGVNLGVPIAQPTLSNTRKRAFLRAQKRAALSGQTQYRGRTYTAAQLQCLATPGQRRTPTTAARPALARPRMPFMIWNCGGLTSVRFKEIRHWIAQHPPCSLFFLKLFGKKTLNGLNQVELGDCRSSTQARP